MTDIVKILENMTDALDNNRFLRSTALDQLKEQEKGDPFKVLIGTILSSRTRDEQTTRVCIKAICKI